MQKIQLGRNYDYNEYLEIVDDLQRTYPDLIKVFKIGTSHDGRDIVLLQVGNGPKPVIITAGVHARETINPIVLLYWVENILELNVNEESVVADYAFPERLFVPNFGGVIRPPFDSGGQFPTMPQPSKKTNTIPSEYDVLGFLYEYTYYLIPILNPDGYEIAHKGFSTIQNDELRENAKNNGVSSSEWKANARGIDINRNFPAKSWKEKFPGDTAASENETQSLIRTFARIPAIGYLDLHSKGESIYYYRGAMPREFNEWQRDIAIRLQDVTGYDLFPPESEIEENDSGGNTVHYFSEYYYQPAITVETVEDEAIFPMDPVHHQKAFQDSVLIPFEFAQAIEESLSNN